MNKITKTRVGDDIHYYVNGVEDRGIVAKMSSTFITIFKEDGKFYEVPINDTFHVADILVNKTWDNMSMEERAEELTKAKAYSPRFLAKSWEQLPREVRDVLKGKFQQQSTRARMGDRDSKHLEGENLQRLRQLGSADKLTDDASRTGQSKRLRDQSKGPYPTRHWENADDLNPNPVDQGYKISDDHRVVGDNLEIQRPQEKTIQEELVQNAKDKFPLLERGKKEEEDRKGSIAERLGRTPDNTPTGKERSKERAKKIAAAKKLGKELTSGPPKDISNKTNKALSILKNFLAKEEPRRLGETEQGSKNLPSKTNRRGSKVPAMGSGNTRADKELYRKLYSKSDLGNSTHGSVAGTPNAGISTQFDLDADKEYEGASHESVKEQFKYDEKKPEVSTTGHKKKDDGAVTTSTIGTNNPVYDKKIKKGIPETTTPKYGLRYLTKEQSDELKKN